MFNIRAKIQYNQPSFSPTLLFSHLILIFLSRIDFILPIQSKEEDQSILLNLLLPLYLPAQHAFSQRFLVEIRQEIVKISPYDLRF
jgi:hypothetical protein